MKVSHFFKLNSSPIELSLGKVTMPMKAGGGVKQNVSLKQGAQVSTHCNPESRNHRHAPSHRQTQWRYLPTTILTNANKEGKNGEGKPATQKQDLDLKTTAQLPRASTHHLKLGKNQHVK